MNWLEELILDVLFGEAWLIARDPNQSWVAHSAARNYLRARRPGIRLP